MHGSSGAKDSVFEQQGSGRVLVVEDRPARRAEYVLALVDGGYAVRAVAGPSECRAAVTREPVDLVVLDLDHPALAPRDLPRQLGIAGRAALLGVADDDCAAIDSGCDALVARPVAPGDLCAHAGSLMRGRARARRYALGPLLLDLDARTLAPQGGAPVALTRGEFVLLARLVEADGAAVERETLCAAIARHADEIDPRTADALVRRIRRKLEPLVDAPVIATVQGAGYRLAILARSVT